VVSDLDLFKKQTEVLGFRSKGWNLLHRDARVATFEIVMTNLIFFPKKEFVVACNGSVTLLELP
jgi:hypothetical protein